jgi:hypothetical protein
VSHSECVIDPDSLKCVACGLPVATLQTYRTCVAISATPPTHGPGTELSRLLKRFGIEPTPTCACRAKAAEMDAWGCDECERPERIDEVVAVMRAEAEARGLPFLDVAGRLLVRRAIRNARNA